MPIKQNIINRYIVLKYINRDIINSLVAFCGAQRPQMRFRAAALRSKTATRLMQVISC